jgi:hypothetical protein
MTSVSVPGSDPLSFFSVDVVDGKPVVLGVSGASPCQVFPRRATGEELLTRDTNALASVGRHDLLLVLVVPGPVSLEPLLAGMDLGQLLRAEV